MKKIFILLIILSLMSCSQGRNQVLYNEPFDSDHAYYINYYNANMSNEELKVDSIYKDFGGYNDNIRIFWFKNLKESNLERERYELYYKNIKFVFEHGDMLYIYCKENIDNVLYTHFTYGYYKYLSDEEINDFYKRYIKFIDEEKKSGRL